MNAVEPPPLRESEPRPRRRFRFNTATLLGVMALVAVVCVVATTMPWLLSRVVALLASALLVAYASFIIAGVVVGEGNRRLFAIAAAASLLFSVVGMPSTPMATYFMERAGFTRMAISFVWCVAVPLQHVVLSLFGGWISIRAAKFWKPDTAPLPPVNPAQSPTGGHRQVNR